ncbi:Magnesium transport protein corA [Salmonella enterica subsp. enterica serovar Paratyphi A]|nr:Magnesium transport protein corA [Salmonella enterica subsp. enterica serovar Paratyphi A]
MLSAFQLENNRLTRLEVEESQPLVNAVWIDLVEPDDDERLRVQSELGQSLATRPELEDIEASARFFEDDDGLHIHSFFFFEDAEDHAGNSTVAFTIRDGRLFTLRERELPAFRLYRMRARSQSMVDGNAYELLLDLFETKIEQLADEIENIYSDLELLSRVIMEGHQGDEYDEALSTLAELEDIGWKVRLCLMDTQRALNFLVRKARLPGGQLEQAREILRDIESLLPHNDFLVRKARLPGGQLEQAREILRDIESLLPHNESLFQKVNFLMQAAMGFINIEQNRIIKIFSVVSVVFLPPTLVASSYGMNFEFMPELKWRFGYPAAIIFMILAGLAPYLYFKRKNWL